MKLFKTFFEDHMQVFVDTLDWIEVDAEDTSVDWLLKTRNRIEIIGKVSPLYQIAPTGVSASNYQFIQQFIQQGTNIFKIGVDFGKQLFHAKMNLPSADVLRPDGINRLIEFPRGFELPVHTGEVAKSFFMCLFDTSKGIPSSNNKISKTSKFMVLSIPIFKEDGTFSKAYDYLQLGFEEGETLEDSLERAKKNSTSAINDKLFEYAIKILLYIQSGDPDLRHLRPTPKPKSNKRKHRLAWERENVCSVPVTYVGYDWRKSTHWRNQDVSVVGHFRWQPFGPNRSQVKLIWIDEHTRQYKRQESIAANYR